MFIVPWWNEDVWSFDKPVWEIKFVWISTVTIGNIFPWKNIRILWQKNKDFLKSNARKSVLVYLRMRALFLFLLILVPVVIETQCKSGKWKVLINNLGFSTMHMALLLTRKWSSLTALILSHLTSHCHLGNVGSIPEIKFSRLTIGIIPSNMMSRIISSPLFKFK